MIAYNGHLSGLTKVHYGGHDLSMVYYGNHKVFPEGTPPVPPTPTPYENQYLTLEMLNTGGLLWSSSTTANTLSYSLDSGATWSEPSSAVSIDRNVYQAGDKIMLKGNMTPKDIYSGIGGFEGTAIFNVEGNIMSLLYGDNFIGQTDLTGKAGAFADLFAPGYGGLFLSNAENLILPATTLANNCYYNMFRSCKRLKNAPKLPATTLANNCYQGMFDGCTSLVKAPKLPATEPVSGCYNKMFQGCSSLNYIKCLATDISARYCLDYWVQNVASTGTFVKASSMSSWQTATSDNNYAGIPDNWTIENV